MTVTRIAERLRPSSAVHDERTAAVLGVALGVCFLVCFATGLLSHLVQDPPGWFRWPPRPAGLYRATQGLHVATGLATIPLLLAKLWVVFPKLFERPVVRDAAHAVERVSLVPLIGGGIFMLSSGVANIAQWYPWPFGFKVSHYWVAWITIGGLVVHVAAKWSVTRAALRSRSTSAGEAHPEHVAGAADAAGVDISVEPADTIAAADRRTFLLSALGASAVVTLVTVGQTFRPLARLALLAPRRPDVGPQGFPVNRTAAGVGVDAAARSADYRLVVEGAVARRLELSVADLRALPHHEATLPIACVEGWSASPTWRGVRVRELLDRAGARRGAAVDVHSLQRGYGTTLDASFVDDDDTLLATAVNGEVLHLDHGFPCRLIAPNRPGTMQTKWVTRLVVT